MRIDPEIAALRSDPALQRRVAARLEAAQADWLTQGLTTAVRSDLARYAAGDQLADLAALAALVSDAHTARAFVDGMVGNFVAALRDEPLGRIPFSHSCQDGLSTLQPLAEGGASLSLIAYEQRVSAIAPDSAIFVDREMHEIVVAGRATVMLRSLSDGEAIASEEQVLEAGSKLSTRDHRAMRQIVAVEGELVILQLSRTPALPRPTREYSLGDGAMLQQACGSKRVSQQEVALAVLGAMKRRDAVPAIAALAVDGPSHLRWEAIRHTIALDPADGVRLLAETAARHDDELAPPASQLQRQLLAQYPQLAPQEPAPCPN